MPPFNLSSYALSHIDFLKQLQQAIINELEIVDEKKMFLQDAWVREQGGGGLTCVLADGNVFEKAGVNFSAIHGEIPQFLKQEITKEFPNAKESQYFLATGLSIVIHPQNPHVPIIHMNIRYFETDSGAYWYGGGIDLTPHYIDAEEAVFFHKQLQTICNNYSPESYTNFKQWADDYFYISHRKETRGIGGIFFDKLYHNQSKNQAQIADFWKSVGNTFAPTYIHLVNINKNKPFTEVNKQFQLLRRGRYVEFNLVYDRGTKFGLQTDGRIESILMSLPKYASWEYNVNEQLGDKELNTLQLLKKGINWIA